MILIALLFLGVSYYKVSQDVNNSDKTAVHTIIEIIDQSFQLFFKALLIIIKIIRALTRTNSIFDSVDGIRDALKDSNGFPSNDNTYENRSVSNVKYPSVLQGKIQYCVTCENWGGTRQIGSVSQYVEYSYKSRGRCYLEKPHIQVTYEPHHHCLSWQKWRALN